MRQYQDEVPVGNRCARVVQVWWGSRAERLCDSRVVQVWWGSRAEPMCCQSRAVLMRFQCRAVMVPEPSSSEEVPEQNHDCFSGKHRIWSVRLDQIQTSLYIQMTMKQPNPSRGSFDSEEARSQKPEAIQNARCWRLPSLLRGSVDYYSCGRYLMYCINPREITL